MKTIHEVKMPYFNYWILASGLIFANLTFAKPIAKCDVLPEPVNVVAQPAYVTKVPCPGKANQEEKLQYQSKPESKPSFGEKESEAREENGAFYDLGTELYVGPDPMITETNQPIVESDSEIPPANSKP